MDSSASLAVGETFAGRVVKVQKHCKNIAEHCISHFTLHCSFVSQVRLEVGPVDRVAKEDINKFLREMVDESSSPGCHINIKTKKTKNRKNHIIGSYNRRTLTGVSVEARLPQLPLFHGPKVLS